MLMRWLWLIVSMSFCNGKGPFSVLAPQAPVYSLLGSSVTLPCTLSPTLNAQSFEVLWYRPQEIHTPLLFYKDQKIQENPRDPQYQSRVSLLGGLEQGNVSLKLENFSLADKGEYICRVEKTEEWYDEATVSLQVKVIGSVAVVSVGDAAGGQVNVSCHSFGWTPEPSLSWRDRDGRNLKHHSKDMFIKDSEGLVNVSSWLLVSPSESQWLSCSVGFSDSNGERKECRVLPQTPKESWKGAFAATLTLLLLTIIGVVVYCLIDSKKKNTAATEATDETHALNDVENQQLLQPQTAETPHQPEFIGANQNQDPEPNVNLSPAAGWDQVKRFKVNITIDPEETPQFFRIAQEGKRVYCSHPNEDHEAEERKIFTLCKEQFSSGQQYWEVKVCQKPKEKLSWFVGVASEEAENMHRIPLTPQNGFWVLCYEKEKGVYIRDSPESTP